jgi:chromosome segregation ATPase
MENPTPVYVKVPEYDEATASLEAIEKKIQEARGLLGRLNELKAEEDKELLAWAESLDEVQGKIAALRANLIQ